MLYSIKQNKWNIFDLVKILALRIAYYTEASEIKKILFS